MKALIEQLERLQRITEAELRQKTVWQLVGSASEELGEVSAAIRVEENPSGRKTVDESSRDEAVDLSICGLSLFFARGGTIEDLVEVMTKKLGKWEDNQRETG